MRVCELRNIINHYLNVILSLTFVIFSGVASAVEINFDDIDVYHDPEGGCFCDHPLTTEYQDKGLLISDGYLVGEKRADGTNDNSLLGSLFLAFTFVDNFPTRVSMIINGVHDQAVFLHAYGNNGWSGHKKTSGYAGPFDDTPYLPNQRVTFYAAEGITNITFGTFYGLRVGAIVDNLQYSYLKLPEPSPALLLLPCLLLAIARRKKSNSHLRM
ncbi:MAG: hypothetical protein B0W54_00815 [Cellvibrio sp. 79]|nr:MAG: hypothetical protein B0W54_00815 [Cellvibrio sp. 79]